MANFLYTCANNKYYAGRKLFDLGTFYDKLPSRDEAIAAMVCPNPDPDGEADPPFMPPYGWLRLQGTEEKPRVTCTKVLLFPRVIRVGSQYTSGIDKFKVLGVTARSSFSLPTTGAPDGTDFTLPGDKTVDFTTHPFSLANNTADQAIFIRKTIDGDPDYTMSGNVESDEHWLPGSDEWESILSNILSFDYARDNVPHSMGVFMTVVRWRYVCFSGKSHPKYCFDDIKKCKLRGSCFFMEQTNMLFNEE